MSIVVDALQPLQQLADVSAAWGTRVDVLVEINAGQDRCACADLCCCADLTPSGFFVQLQATDKTYLRFLDSCST